MFVAYAENHSVDRVAFIFCKLAANYSQEKPQPSTVTFFSHVVFNRKGDDPLAAVFVCWVFPFGANAFLENQIVGVGDDICNGVGIVVHAPKIFNGSKSKHFMQHVLMVPNALLLASFLLAMGKSINIPERPPRVKVRYLF
jgi:hypothetical protein